MQKKALKLKLEVDCMLRSIEEKLYEMKARIDKNFLLYHNVVVDQIRNVSQVINFRRSKSNLDYTLPNLEDRKQFWMTSLEKLHKIRFELIDSFQVHMELQQMKVSILNITKISITVPVYFLLFDFVVLFNYCYLYSIRGIG